MKNLTFFWIAQLFLLLLLFRKDKNDGGKELFKKQHWKMSDVAVVVLPISVSPFLLVLMGYILSKLNVNSHGTTTSVHSFAIYIGLLVLLIVLFKFRFKKNTEVLGVRKNDIKQTIFPGIFLGLIGYLLIDASVLLLWPKRYAEEVTKAIRMPKAPVELSLYLLVALLLGPVVEEVIYRGICYSPYRKKYGVTKAVIMTSLLFAMAHYSFVPFLFGVLLTAMYEKTESIILCIIAHSMRNLLAILSWLFLVNGIRF